MHGPDIYQFPDPRDAPSNSPLAWGGDLSPDRLLSAYSRGIFPWFNEGDPCLWWSPDPRFVISADSFRVQRSLRKVLRKPGWHLTLDESFTQVIRACAQMPRPDQAGTWLTREMIDAYCELHRLGYAHSVACYYEGALAGGLYGVSLGGVFCGESMFHHRAEGSKIAFARLAEQLFRWDFDLIDCQMPTRHMERFGGFGMSRSLFLDLLKSSMRKPTRQGRWQFDEDLSGSIDDAG